MLQFVSFLSRKGEVRVRFKRVSPAWRWKMAAEVGKEPRVSKHPLPSLTRGVCFLPLEQSFSISCFPFIFPSDKFIFLTRENVFSLL